VLKLHANYNTGRANISLVDHKLFIFGHGKHKNSLDGRGNWNADNSAVTTFSAPTSLFHLTRQGRRGASQVRQGEEGGTLEGGGVVHV